MVLEEAEERLTEKRAAGAYRQLVDYMKYKQEKTQKRLRAQVFYNMAIQRKFLYVWSRYQCYEKRLGEINAVYRIKNKKVLTSKVFKFWKKYTRDNKIKSNLKDNLTENYNSKLLNKAYLVLETYKSRRIAQRTRDQAASKEISKLPLQRVYFQIF